MRLLDRWWMVGFALVLFGCAIDRLLNQEWAEAIRELVWAFLVLGWTWPRGT